MLKPTLIAVLGFTIFQVHTAQAMNPNFVKQMSFADKAMETQQRWGTLRLMKQHLKTERFTMSGSLDEVTMLFNSPEALARVRHNNELKKGDKSVKMVPLAEVDDSGRTKLVKMNSLEKFDEWKANLPLDEQEIYTVSVGQVYFNERTPLDLHPRISLLEKSDGEQFIWDQIHQRARASMPFNPEWVMGVAKMAHEKRILRNEYRITLLEERILELRSDVGRAKAGAMRGSSLAAQDELAYGAQLASKEEELALLRAESIEDFGVDRVVELIRDYEVALGLDQLEKIANNPILREAEAKVTEVLSKSKARHASEATTDLVKAQGK